MARPKTNVVIKKSVVENLLEVWTLAPAEAKKIIEAIEGAGHVYHDLPSGYLHVWLNPCYDKAEIEAEIRAALFDHQRDRVDWRPKERKWWPRREKTIGNMRVGETGYTVPWAVGGWDWLPYPDHLDGLNLMYPVEPSPKRGSDTLICRTETGWVVEGRIFPEKAQKAFGGTIAAMRPGETGYIVNRAFDGGDLDKRYTVFRYPVGPADTRICRTNDGWVVGGKVFKDPD